jgi:hypothetical protein
MTSTRGPDRLPDPHTASSSDKKSAPKSPLYESAPLRELLPPLASVPPQSAPPRIVSASGQNLPFDPWILPETNSQCGSKIPRPVNLSNGIGMTVRTMTGWGVKFLDYDNDGNMDIFITSGHPDDKVSQRYSEVHYLEYPLLWRNLGTGYRKTYQNVSDQSGPIFSQRVAGRGLANGDFNNDGGIDVLMVPN